MAFRSLVAVVPAAAALLLGAAPARADVITYNAPDGIATGSGIEADASGRVWFTTNDFTSTPRLGRLTVASAQAGTSSGIDLFATPTTHSNAAFVRDVTLDPRDGGRIWWSRSDGGYGYGTLGSIAPGTGNGMSGAFVPGFVDTWNVKYDASVGRVWLAERSTNNVKVNGQYPGARIAFTDGRGLGLGELPNLADQGSAGTIDSLRYDAKPMGVVPDGKGEAWFVESDPGNPGWRLGHTSGGNYTEYGLPCLGSSPCSGSYTGSGPNDTAVAPDGKVWFTNALSNAVTKFDPATQQFTSYALRSFDSALLGPPSAIAAAPDGSIWVAERIAYNAGAIVKIVPSTTDATVSAGVTKIGGLPQALDIAPTGDVWFNYSPASGTTGAIGRITGGAGAAPAPGADPSLPGTPATPSAGPTVTVAPTVMGSGSVGRTKTAGDLAIVDQICVGPPADKCSLVYILSANEYVSGFPNTKLGLVPRFAAKPKKPKKKKEPVVIGQATAELVGGETRQVTVPLGKKASKALKKQKHFKATLTISQKQADGTLKQLSKKTVSFTYKKPKKGAKK